MSTPIQLTIGVHGMEKTVATIEKVRRSTLEAVARAINVSAFAIDRMAKRLCPVDTGRLRSSIRPHFDRREGLTIAARVGTDAKYAAFVEFGTSALGARTNKQPLPSGYRHGESYAGVPATGLAQWARRHKLDAWAVAMAIAGRGFRGAGFGARKIPGTRARPFLFPAFEAERPRITAALARAVLDGSRRGTA